MRGVSVDILIPNIAVLRATNLALGIGVDLLSPPELSDFMNRKLKNEELGRKDQHEFKKAKKSKVVVALNKIRSAHNVGSIFRTSDAFLVEEILLGEFSPKPPQREIMKTALGATETVDWRSVESLKDELLELKKKGYRIFSIEQAERSHSLGQFEFTDEPCVIVLGNEVEGVDQDIIDLSDSVIEIPQLGSKHSFNVSVTAGMVLWEIFRKSLD
jgi:tRNA G18 (ribose-2'-O)-methylase SpoU